jgi:hypothetical protein
MATLSSMCMVTTSYGNRLGGGRGGQSVAGVDVSNHTRLIPGSGIEHMSSESRMKEWRASVLQDKMMNRVYLCHSCIDRERGKMPIFHGKRTSVDQLSAGVAAEDEIRLDCAVLTRSKPSERSLY